MKKLMLLCAAFALTVSSYGQVKAPQPSPSSKLEQKVGLTDFTIEYSRPSMRGRTVFGDLVPFDKKWRTGANKNTTITFTDNVMIGDYTLKPGSYAIYTKPGESLWEVYFYANTDNWGLPEKWDEANVAAIAKVKSYSLPFDVQTFTIDINNITNGGGTIDMIWEKTYIAIPFSVPTDDKVLASINESLNGNPTDKDYFAAAMYYYQEGKDINQAKEWMDKAINMTDNPQFWQLRQQSLIYAKAGDTKGAIDIAKKSLEGAKAAGNEDYVKMNMDSLKEWGAM